MDMSEKKIKKNLRTNMCDEIIKNKDYPLKDDEPLTIRGLIDSFSLVEPILKRVKANPEELAVIFMESDESEERVSIRQLHSGACIYANALKESGIKPGDIVILALSHCKDLVYAFWGTLYAGAVPSIFVYKGPMSTVESYIDRLKDMVHTSSARMVITFPYLVPGLKKCLPGLDCGVVAAGEIRIKTKNSDIFPNLTFTSGEQTAYLQYTSGTTGMKKGVRLSHRAILSFVRSFARALHIVSNDVFVNWLPFYHDFGLFAGLISPLLFGIPAVLISPFKWLRNPKVLLWAIHNHKGTISFLPNSAHNHIVRSVPVEGLEGLDLSSLRVLGNGSEPVLYKSQEIFLEHFAPYGFRETALVSGYGMAESTLGVTLSTVGERSPVDWVDIKEMQTTGQAVPAPPHSEGSKASASSGVPLEGVEVAVVDDNGSRLPERRIGEIIIRSNSLFSGYHKHQDLTDQVMNDGWYHTGDLGYMAKGELYVCGRKKDLIIVGGSNIHPEDLEAIADSVPGIYGEAVVAFGIMDDALGTEKIVMICGLEHPVTGAEKLDIERKLRRRVFQELDVTLGEVHLHNKRWILKTQSGKITRTANREKYKELILKENK